MGVKKIHVPGCGCCQGMSGCLYTPSDGCEYSDTFGSLDAGWLTANASVAVVSGRLEVTATHPTITGYTYRSFTVGGSSFYVIVEVTLPEVLREQGLRVTGSGTSHQLELGATTGDGYIVGTYSGLTYTGVLPAANDKITIHLMGLGDGMVRACFFVNEVEIHSETGTQSPSTLTEYRLITSNGTWTTKYDNFTIQTSACCCEDLIPATLAVTISGVNSGTTNITLDAGTCTIECDQLNDDYTFTNNSPCQWSTTRDWDVTCGGTPTTETFRLFLYFQTSSGTRYLYFLIKTGTNYVQYLGRQAMTTDCCDLATTVLELSSYLSSSFCTANLTASSELEITASTCV